MTVKEKLKYYLYLMLLYPLAALPLRVLYLISDLIYFVLFKIMKYRYKVVHKNLVESFLDKDEKWIAKTEKEFYRNLADVIVETVKLLCISDRNLMRRVKVTNPEIITEMAYNRQRPIILYLGHYGNWEWVTAITKYFDLSKIYGGHIYRKQKDVVGNKLFMKIRSRLPSVGIELKSAVREILRISSEHPAMMIGFIADHRFNSANRKEATMFLNHVTPYYVGGEAIGEKIGADYLYLDVEKTSRGHYRLTYIPIVPDPDDKNPHPITRKYMKMMEKTIMRQPPYWLWSHKRWINQEVQAVY